MNMSHTAQTGHGLENVQVELADMSLIDSAIEKGTNVPYIGDVLPVEIRLQIFEYSDLQWNGKVPNVIKALRP